MPRLYQVDAFSDKPFAGNPAAVCILEGPRERDWMQNVAAEMNLAETAFLTPVAESEFGLLWFTPVAEVDLCGHATLATAHVLWETGQVAAAEPCRFRTRSGLLTARRAGDRIELDFPSTPVRESEMPARFIEAVGADPVFTGLSRHDWLIAVKTAQEVRGLSPDFAALTSSGFRGVIVTALDESGEFDFVSRFFAPGVGINEDPVTGSAHCALGPYWQGVTGKSEFRAYQASPRGGAMDVVVQGERVLLRGTGVTVLVGELRA